MNPAEPENVTPYPSHNVALALLLVLLASVAVTLSLLLSVDDPVRLKALIEDDGPVQGVGLTCIALCLAMALFYTVFDRERRSSYLLLSYLLLFYTLREADYHYRVSEYAKATQFKRFFLHEQIPLTTKLFLATIIVLFLIALYQYLTREKSAFLLAVRQRLPWALFTVGWGVSFFFSQLVDQVPLFHNVSGQVAEELLESTAQAFALTSMILFRLQARANRQAALGGLP